MNKLILAIKQLDIAWISELLEKQPKWTTWQEDSGKNALHYLCGVPVSNNPVKGKASLEILKLLLKKGMDKNAVHKIPDPCGFFPATPLWYAYAKGRNEKLYSYLLKNGANPDHCLYAIAWNDDVKAGRLFKKHGARITESNGIDTPFLAAMMWRRFNVAKWFLENGADVNAVDKKGNSALFYALKRKYDPQLIKHLTDRGARVKKG